MTRISPSTKERWSCQVSLHMPGTHFQLLPYVRLTRIICFCGQSVRLTPVWSSQFPPGHITGVYPKRPNEHVHSSGRVLADRSVLYKYTNPNLAVITAQGTDNADNSEINHAGQALISYEPLGLLYLITVQARLS